MPRLPRGAARARSTGRSRGTPPGRRAAAHRTRPSSAVAAEYAAWTAKQVAEIVHVKLIAAAGACRLLLPLLIASRFRGVKTGGEPGLAEFVVELALFRISQGIIGDRDLFELIFRLFITRVDIRMIFSSEFAIRLADFFSGGISAHAQDVVKIALGHCKLE